jgi:two-component system NtrC family sensor kinase
MKKIILVVFFLIPIIALAAPGTDSTFNINKILDKGVLLDKGWKFHAGDNFDWAKPGFDDRNWNNIDPSKDIYFLPQVRKAEIGWFRLKLNVAPSLFNKTLGLIVYQTGASDIYLNGKLIYHLGKIVNGAKNKSLRFYDYQLSLRLDTNRIQEIAVRFSCNKNDLIINYLTPNYCARLVLTNIDDLVSNFMSETNSFLIKDIILVTLYVFLGVMSFFLYFSYRVQRAYLFFGFYCFTSIIQALLRVPTYAIKPVGLSLASTCFLLSHIVSIFAILLLLAGLYKVYSQKKSILFYFIILYTISTLPVFIFFYPWSNIYAVAFALLMCIDAAIINFRAVISGFSNAWVLFISFLIFFLMFVCFMLIAVSGNVNLGLNIAALSLLVIPFGLSIFLANEFARTGRDLQIRIVEVEQLSEKAILQEQEKQQILTSQNEILETQVSERTAALNQSLNNLKATQNQLIQSEKMASLGELTAGIAHEIQNPLNFVNNFSEVNTELIAEMKQEIENGDLEEIKALAADIEENSKKINAHGKRADAIVKGMLQHSQSSSGKKEPTDINALANEYLRLSYHGLRAKDKTFNAEMITHFDEHLPKINVIPQDIGRVFINLFNNAFYAIQQKAKIAREDYTPIVEITTFFFPLQGVGGLKVKDNGIGIPETIKDKIMQPFFTTKPTGEGTGLGLSLSYDIVVKGHGGVILVNSKEGEGSEFIISLPLNA